VTLDQEGGRTAMTKTRNGEAEFRLQDRRARIGRASAIARSRLLPNDLVFSG
jgi:hypothetical protein